MRPDSNSLLQQLARIQRAPAASGDHPDADQLAAFAEDTLLPSERLGVLSHLAICPECREVLKVATAARPDSDQEATTERIPRPSRPPFWTWLPWAAAASIVAIATILLLHPQKPQPPRETASASPQPAPGPQAPIPAEATQPPASAPRPAKAARNKPQLPAEQPPQASVQSTLGVAQPQSNRQFQTELKLSAASAGIAPAATAIPPQTPLSNDGAIAAKAASQTVAVQASPAQNALLPQTMNSAPASLGGPIVAGPVARQLSALAVRPQWRINQDGQVERSFGNQNWQQVLDAGTSKLRVVSVMGASVWAGGDNLRLYRSLDNGATWNAIQLPPQNGAAGAITHVRFQTPLDGRIDAADGTSWVTSDGGATWK